MAPVLNCPQRMGTQIQPAPITYEILELLGRGANGSVFKAVRRDKTGHLSHTVALKILHSEKSVDTWKREFESLVHIASPHCARAFGFEWFEGQPVLVLEWIDGVTLAELSHLALSVGEILHMGEAIARGLSELSAQNICHGDLSPTNIMVDRRGQVRLVDFGFGNTAAGRRQVTREFAAPEVLSGQNPSLSSDWWSLGKIIEYLQGPGDEPIAELARLLHPCPEQREWHSISTEGDGGSQSLQRKVAHLVARRQRPLNCTSTLCPSTKGTPWRGLSLALFFVLTSSSGFSSLSRETAVVRIRSQYGLKIFWQGRAIGHAPLDLLDLPPTTYELAWEGEKQQGRRALTLKPGDRILIDDQTFFKPSP